MPNPFSQLIKPRLPAAALGLEGEFAAAVSLDHGRRGYALRSAAHVPLPAGLVTPGFTQPNITHPGELTEILADLVVNAGLARRHRWSVSLPELVVRTTILLLESTPSSRAELEEMLNWKVERAFGAPPAEMRLARERLSPDERGRARYLVTGVRLEVLVEYENVFNGLGWQAGLILPRHLAEGHWLTGGPAGNGDALLVSTHRGGFTALIVRGREPLLIRHVACEERDRSDELYRLLLFYRDRAGKAEGGQGPQPALERIMLIGSGMGEPEVSDCVGEALEARPRFLGPEAVGLALPTSDLSFETLAAPAGLAALKWA